MNKKNLGLRVITFIPRLIFIIFWMVLYGVLLNIRWLRFGSQELYFGEDFGRGELVSLIDKLDNINTCQENHTS